MDTFSLWTVLCPCRSETQFAFNNADRVAKLFKFELAVVKKIKDQKLAQCAHSGKETRKIINSSRKTCSLCISWSLFLVMCVDISELHKVYIYTDSI